jgi:hypothetical protein
MLILNIERRKAVETLSITALNAIYVGELYVHNKKVLYTIVGKLEFLRRLKICQHRLHPRSHVVYSSW